MKQPNKNQAFHENLAKAKQDREIPKMGTQVPIFNAKQIITEGKNLFTNFAIAGLSLLEFAPKLEELRRNKSYKALGYKTWEQCCIDGIETSKRWVDETILGSKIRAALPKIEAKKITSVSQTRALSDVPEEDRAEVIKAAEKESKDITPKSIKTAAKKVVEDKSKEEATFREIVKDANGDEVPEEIAAEFQRSRDEVKDIRAKLNEVRRWLENEEQFKAEIARAEAMESVKDVLSMVAVGAGDYLCPICKGKKCKVCRKRGFVSKLFYTQKISDDKK